MIFFHRQYLNPALTNEPGPRDYHGPPYDILVDELTSTDSTDYTNEQVEFKYYIGMCVLQ